MSPHIRLARILVLALALGACQTMSDLTPGQGQNVTITGHPYDQVWDAALKVVERHFAIREQSKPEGVIFAERSGVGGGWIGVYFTGAGADTIRVEVVRKGKYMGQIAWTDWPRTVLRELQVALGQKPTP